MTTQVWQPGTLYSPGAIVQRNSASPVTSEAPVNADFELGDVSWTKEAPWEIDEFTKKFTGTWSARCRGVKGDFRIYGATPVPVVPGLVLTASCSILRQDNGARGQIQLEWLDSSNVSIAVVDGSVMNSGEDKWKTSTVTATAPSAAAFVRVGATAHLKDTTTGLHVDGFKWNYAYTLPPDALLFRAVQATPGYSGGTEPTWPTVVGLTVVDNEVTWEAIDSSTVTWEAAPILVSGATEPDFPTEVGASVSDNTIVWTAISRRVEDEKCPNTKYVAIAASKVFAGDDDIIGYSATVNPLDWSTQDDAGYLPFGLQTHGANPVRAMGLYRGNLVAFNSAGFQMWQVDPDPQSMALLDSAPVGCTEPKSVRPFQNDLIFLSPVGLRNISIAGASTNLQAGSTGDPVDAMVIAKLEEGAVVTASVFLPKFGQYWVAFGDEVFVLTINDLKKSRWSRYTFPESLVALTLLGSDLYARTDSDHVWKLTYDQVEDDVPVGITAKTTLVLTSDAEDIDGFTYTGYNSDTALGALVPAVVSVNTVNYFMARSVIDAEYQSKVLLSMSVAGNPSAEDAFTTILFVDADGSNRELLRADAVVPAGTVAGNARTWEWNVSNSLDPTPLIFSGGGEGAVDYDITFVYPVEEVGGEEFNGVLWWPHLDFGSLGGEKLFVGFDLVADAPAGVSISIGYDQRNRDARTPDYSMDGDTLPARLMPIPVSGPSFDMRLTFEPNQYWEWQAAVIYIQDMRSGT